MGCNNSKSAAVAQPTGAGEIYLIHKIYQLISQLTKLSK